MFSETEESIILLPIVNNIDLNEFEELKAKLDNLTFGPVDEININLD